MRAEPEQANGPRTSTLAWCWAAVILAALGGLVLMAQECWANSATYDEVAYLKIAARWWRTGDQEEITRMGSPLTFWKLQQAPGFLVLDLLGRRTLVDDPMRQIATVLPLLRVSSLWIWLVAFGLTVMWSRVQYGPRAMAFAAWLFALSPNLLAHGALVTMELPLIAASTGVFFCFWRFLRFRHIADFCASAALCGLAFSCKFSAVLFPPMVGLVWWLDGAKTVRRAGRTCLGMFGYIAVLLLADLIVTGFAVLPLSHSAGHGHPSIEGRFSPVTEQVITRLIETPIPRDWVGFSNQLIHQRSGGWSYLLGERRMQGWWYYYLVAIAVKAPLTLWLLLGVRLGRDIRRMGTAHLPGAGGRCPPHEEPANELLRSKAWSLPVLVALFLFAASAGSSRNYGVRYVLPIAPIAIVWLSALAESRPSIRIVAAVALVGQAIAVVSVHPHELSYFHVLAGGPVGGRRILADSNLDWGQGLVGLARIQKTHVEYRDLTLYYFGDLDVSTIHTSYRIEGEIHVINAGLEHPDLPATFDPASTYVAVSASLQWGPWGPAGYFRRLDGVQPMEMTDDSTIAIYRTADLYLTPAQ
jgi:hypothetical protein